MRNGNEIVNPCIIPAYYGMVKNLHQVGFIWKDFNLQVWQLFLLLSNKFLTFKLWNSLALFSFTQFYASANASFIYFKARNFRVIKISCFQDWDLQSTKLKYRQKYFLNSSAKLKCLKMKFLDHLPFSASFAKLKRRGKTFGKSSMKK